MAALATIPERHAIGGEPAVAVCVPVFNKIELTRRFLESFAAIDYANYTIVITDDGSTDGTAEVLAREQPNVVLLRGDGDLWWTGGTNLAVEYALAHGFDYVLTINNDAKVSPLLLRHLVETAQRHPRSIVGSRLNVLQNPRRVWAMGGVMDWASGRVMRLRENDVDEDEVLRRNPNPVEVAAVNGCGTLIEAACFREIGLYDAKRYPQYHADVEFTLRAIKRGYRVLVDTRAVVWNDIVNTAQYVNRRAAVFSKGSFHYWRPMLAIHLAYCPPRHLPGSLWVQYRWLIPRLRVEHLRRLVARVQSKGRSR